MTIARCDLTKTGMVGGTAVSVTSVLRAQTAPTSATIHRVKYGAVCVFDPVIMTTNVAIDPGTQVYDALFPHDFKFIPQPQ